MTKAKKLVAAVLGLSIAISGISFAGCNKDEEKSGGNKDNTTEAFTMVANAEEWKAAFDNVFKSDSFHGTGYQKYLNKLSNKEEYNSEDQLYVDFKNGLLLSSFKLFYAGESGTLVKYDEIVGDNVYSFSKWKVEYEGEEVDVVKRDFGGDSFPEEKVDLFSGRSEIEQKEYYYFLFRDAPSGVSCYALFALSFRTNDSIGSAKPLSELFSEFTYENGCYVSDKLELESNDYDGDSHTHIEVEIKNGIVSRIEYSCEYSNEVEKLGFTIDGINSTTVTIPDGAREAIDAEKAKG